MKRLTKQEWINEGFNSLKEKGDSAIRIETLCERLKVSKGSFYHHFQSMDTYIQELLESWERENTTSIIEASEQIKDFDQKTTELNEQVIQKDQQVEVMIRSWAIRDPRISQFLKKVDQQRIEFLKKLYLEKGVDEEKAGDMAKIEYCAFVGMQHLFRELPKEELIRISQLFNQLLKHF